MISVIVLSSCQHPTAPRPPAVPYCPVIAVEGGIPYLKCYMTDKPKEIWRVKIDDEFWKRKEKTICTSDKGYADIYYWGKELERWADKNCGK